MAEYYASDDTEVDIEEEVKDFAARFARLVVSRAFRESGDASGAAASASESTAEPPGVPQQAGSGVGVDKGSTGHMEGVSSSRGGAGVGGGRDALSLYVAEAEVSLRGAQRLGAQLEEDAGVLRSKIFPDLLDNARQLHALYLAIDRVAEEVFPEIEATVKRMEKSMYNLEELRKEQVDTRSPQGSFGLGLALGAGLWSPKFRDDDVPVPEIFETNKVFRVEEGGLAPL